MKKILIIGAGRSSASLVSYLLDYAEENNWEVIVGDQHIQAPQERIKGHPNGRALAFNALDQAEREPLIEEADLVVSMLPARFHTLVIEDCITHSKPCIAPSYVSKEIKAMEGRIKAAGIPVLMECGLDPGIDHMSAMEVIDRITNQGGKLMRFESFTGGLVAPESDDNPWNYKFTWNPRNVVLAGQGGAARFIQEGLYKYVPYHKLFTRVKPISIEGYGDFEGYANRDSLQYKDVYNLGSIPTIYRGTLRRAGYSEAWNVFVQLGMTDDSYQVEECSKLTWRTFTNSFLAYSESKPVEQKLQEYTGASDEVMEKLRWLGMFDDVSIGLESGTPAQILQKRLESKWSLKPGDKDMIVMWHRFNYELNGEEKEIHSSMVVLGDDEEYTA
ncbi:MAG: saccharopine dehydrogenase, partial [Flavobacteriales bacterium]|nr:saccharopine dehydrogenase [Flavobacteriales bacterium]